MNRRGVFEKALGRMLIGTAASARDYRHHITYQFLRALLVSNAVICLALSSALAEDIVADAGLFASGEPPGANRVLEGGITPENMTALKEVGERFGISPLAIAAMIDTESKWRPRTVTGSYRGLTQIGPENPEWAVIRSMSAADQIRIYGRWLKRYRFREKIAMASVDFSRMTPAQQAAYLQGFQFAPNAMAWQYAAGRGDFRVRTTMTRQARVLGSTTLSEMTRYYQKLLGPRAVLTQTATGEAATRAFNEGIESVKAPIQFSSEEEKEPEKQRTNRNREQPDEQA